MKLWSDFTNNVINIFILIYDVLVCILTAYFLINRKRRLKLHEKSLFCFWVLSSISASFYTINLVLFIFFQGGQLLDINRKLFVAVYIVYFFQSLAGFFYIFLRFNIKKTIVGFLIIFLSLLGVKILYSYIAESQLVIRYGEPYLAPLRGAPQTYQVALLLFCGLCLVLLLIWLDFKRGISSWGNLSNFYMLSGITIFAANTFYQIFYAVPYNQHFAFFHFLFPYLMYLSKKEEEKRERVFIESSLATTKTAKSIFWKFFGAILTIVFVTGLTLSWNIYQSYERILDLQVRTDPSFSVEKIKNIEVNIQNTWIAVVSLFFFVFVLVIILSILFVNATLKQLRNLLFAVKEIQTGKKGIRAQIEGDDELAFLSKEFNKMIENIEKSHEILEDEKKTLDIRIKARTRELTEINQLLEEKVRERTRELQQKIDELEKFHQLTVGREMKMIELKKEIKKLKQELAEFKKNKGQT